MSRIVVLTLILLSTAACIRVEKRSREDRSEGKKHANSDNSIAFHAGEAAHALAKESAKAAAVAERKLEKTAKEAHQGWKESEEKDRHKSSDR